MATRIIDRLYTVLGYQYDATGLAGFERSMRRAKARLNDFSRSTGKIGLAVTAAATATVRGFGNFESQMAQIEGLVGISREQLDAWRGDIEAIARETGQSPQKLAEALFFVTSAGLRGEEAMSVLRASAQAAAVGLGDQAQIVDLLTGAMNIYGPEVLSAARANDVLVKAIKEGKLEASTLGPALSGVLPFAAEVGVEYEEVAGALAAMSRQNIGARRGAVALRGVFNKLIRPAAMAHEALEDAGLSADWLRRKVADEGLLPALLALRRAFEGDSEALGRVFEDSEALLGVLALTNDTAAENARIIDSVADSTGALNDAYAVTADTLNHKTKQALAGIRVQLIGIGEQLAPLAHQVLGFVQSGLAWLQRLDDRWKRVLGVIGATGPLLLGVAAAAKLTAISLGVLTPIVKLLAPLFVLAGKSTLATRLGLLGIGAGSKIAAGGLALFKVALLGVPIIGWIAALVLAGVAVWKFRDEIVAGLSAAWEWVSNLFGRIGEWLSGLDWSDIGLKIIKTLIAGMVPGGPLLFKAVRGIFGKVRDLLPFSDARTGPLSDLTRNGRMLAETLARGVDRGAARLQDSVTSALTLGSLALPVGPAPVGGPVGGVNVSATFGDIVLHGVSGDPEDISRAVADGIGDQMRGLAENVDSSRRA